MNEYYPECLRPEDEACRDGQIPEVCEQTIRVADGLATLPKVFFDRNRRMLFARLNQYCRSGQLKQIVGFAFSDTRITRQSCEFTGWEFRRIDRENFYTYVFVTLKLTAQQGVRPWQGFMAVWCRFAPELRCSVEYMSGIENLPQREGEILLSPFAVPYMRGIELDKECEMLWEKYGAGSGERRPGKAERPMKPAEPEDPEGKSVGKPAESADMSEESAEEWEIRLAEEAGAPGEDEPRGFGSRRAAEELAGKFGLSVRYLPVYHAEKTGSILFFAEGMLLIRKENMASAEAGSIGEGRSMYEKAHPPQEMRIPAKTIVINTNMLREVYAAFSIYHEIIHYEFHYLFFCLQEMYNDDFREIKIREITVKPNEKITDPLYWMEKQASRGAYGFLMPTSWLRGEIDREARHIPRPRHAGEYFELVGRRICYKYRIANFRMRARLIQMGYIAAKGSLNWLKGGKRVEPFAFDPDNCRKIEETFVIDPFAAEKLYEENEAFRKALDSGDFIPADGHIVRNDARFVRETSGGLMLTPWANAHVDRCCLRFMRVYIQGGIGQYIFGRMNLDEDYVKQTMFYLEDFGNQEIMNEMEAELKYREQFPATFTEGLKMLMDKNGITMQKMAEKIHVEERTFQRWMADDARQFNADFVVSVSLVMRLPDWISDLLMDRAGLALSGKNPRHLALQWIRRTMWMDGLDNANEYLKQKNFEPLHA